ncbi:MAG: nascent polypeptide-associated complex protein [Candidatus Micrarchaeaceae archaeon]
MKGFDLREIKNMMKELGIKSEEIAATRVVIEGADKDIIITNPEVVLTDTQGVKVFNISGEIEEKIKPVEAEISDADIKFVEEQAGISDDEAARRALVDAGGNIAEAVMRLKKGNADANTL